MFDPLLRPFLRGAALSLVLVVACVSTRAQETTSLGQQQVSTKALEAFRVGKDAARKGDKRQAVRYLERSVEDEPRFAEALFELGGLYYSENDFARAEPYFERVAGFANQPLPEALYFLALTEMKARKQAEAVPHLDAYLASGQLREDRRKAAQRYRDDAAFQAEALAVPVSIKLEAMPASVNTPESSEYLPSFTADQRQLMFTRRVNNKQEDIYVSDYRDSAWQVARPVMHLNTPGNEASQTISADGRLVVFTACDRKEGLGSCDLYFSQLVDGAWTAAANLGRPVNTPAWDSQPCLSANGNLLFFASKRPGGHGGSDIYASARTTTGWTEPTNLGPVVNSPEDDESPFFHADGQTLYFMSNGRPGMGGFDLYRTRLDSTNTWLPPSNLGYPLNTDGNEGALVVSLDGRTAYYATDVATVDATGVGVGGARGRGTDLYTFQLPPLARAKVVTYVRATVVDAVTDEPIGATALISDAATDKAFLQRRADPKDGQFLAVLPSGKTYSLSVEEPGYSFYSDRFELTQAANAEQPYELLIRLQPIAKSAGAGPVAEAEPIVLRNVLFATGSAELLPASFVELGRLRSLLSENPTVKIRLQGHTDNVGDPAANLKLSDARAAAVATYLTAQGVAAERLSSAGFGESRPVAPNSTAEGRRLNRRTEFVVVAQ